MVAVSDYTDAELAALKSAYATGVLRVTYEGRTTEYDTGAGLLARIREIERDMTPATGRTSARFAGFRRGLG